MADQHELQRQDDELDVEELEDVTGGGEPLDQDAVVNNCDCTNNCG